MPPVRLARAFALAALFVATHAVAVPRSFDQPAQPLSEALKAFARTAGVTVGVDAALVEGKRAPALDITAEPAEALARLLAGSGLVGVAAGGGFVVEAAPAARAQEAMLPPINVVGRGETAWSQVDGYVAFRSQTATKTDTPILETPQSITVVTRDEMNDQNAQSVKQALRYTPGTMSDTRAGFSGFDVMFARGFTLDRYLDGLKLLGGANFTTPQIDPFELERIDVLRGPASTLYGQSSPGGLVNMISKRPTSERQGEVYLQAASHSQFQGGFDLAGPATADGSLLYRLTGLGRGGDSQVDFVKDERFSIAPAITWRPNADSELTVLARYQDAPKAGYYNFVPADGSVLSNPNGTIPTSFYSGDPSFNTLERKEWSIGYLFEYRFADTWKVRQNLRYMRTTGTVNQVLPLFLEEDQRTLERYVMSDQGAIDAFGVDTQAEARFTTGPVRHTLLLGIDYQYTKEDDVLGLDFGPPIDIFAPTYFQPVTAPAAISDTKQTQRQLGVYAQDQMKIDAWSLLLGIRHDNATTDTLDRMSGTTAPQSDNAWSGRVGLVYVFDNQIAPYASYVTSFQPVPGIDYDGNALKPTEGQQFELGVKYAPLRENALITLALFDLTQRNVPTIDPDHPTFNRQTGKVRTRGFEASAKASLADGWNVSAAYTYLDSTVLSGTPENEGKTPLYTPKNAVALWLEHAFSGSNLAGLALGGGVRYVGSTFGNDANTLEVPANTLVDLSLRYDLGAVSPTMKGLQFQVNATNLFDKVYVSECTNDNCLYGLRRQVQALLSYRW